jgi:hypothetical protein
MNDKFKTLFCSEADNNEFSIEISEKSTERNSFATLFTKDDNIFIGLSTHEGESVHLTLEEFEAIYFESKKYLIDRKKQWLEFLEVNPEFE